MVFVYQYFGTAQKNNLAATTDPAVTDDSASGYSIGSRWINVATDHEFVCTDATQGAALWVDTTTAVMTNDLVTVGTDTTQRTITAAQAKLAAQTWGAGIATSFGNDVYNSADGIVEHYKPGYKLRTAVANPASPYTPPYAGESIIPITGLDHALSITTPSGIVTSTSEVYLFFDVTASAADRVITPSGYSILGAGTTFTVASGSTRRFVAFTRDSGTTWIWKGEPAIGNINGLQASIDAAKVESFIIPATDRTTTITAGTNKTSFPMPYAFTVTAVSAYCNTAPTGLMTIDVNEDGTSILGTKLTIDANEQGSWTAATAATITDAAIAANAIVSVDVDSTTGGTGLTVTIVGYKA